MTVAGGLTSTVPIAGREAFQMAPPAIPHIDEFCRLLREVISEL